MMQINRRGAFICCHAVVAHMQKRGRGIIVNVGSSSACMADDDLGPYTATKWGVVGCTASLVHSLGPHGIRVNGLNPGWMDTDMSREFDPAGNPE